MGRARKMKTFRIDNRVFDVNGVIPPQNQYQGQLTGDRANVEEILEANRPEDKPRRNEILMVFQNFDDAKGHWTIQTNSKFYRTEIADEDVLHIGDYNKIEELHRNINDPERAAQIAIEYWQEVMTDNPKPEIFVATAPVTHVLSNNEQERKNALKLRHNFEPIRGVRIVTDVD